MPVTLIAAEAPMHNTACSLLKLKFFVDEAEGNTEEEKAVFDISLPDSKWRAAFDYKHFSKSSNRKRERKVKIFEGCGKADCLPKV